MLKPFKLSLGLSGTALVSLPTTAAAYAIDCAIFLCMAGGFPSNAVCDQAYAEVIRRVTPYPIEPPLQLWRCPMGASSTGPHDPDLPYIQNATWRSSYSERGFKLWLAQAVKNDDYTAFTRELRVIYGSGYYIAANSRRSLQWRSTIKICDGNSKNCTGSTLGTGLGSGENGNVGVPAAPGPNVSYTSDLYNKTVSVERITRRGVRLLYWGFEGNPSLTEWIYY